MVTIKRIMFTWSWCGFVAEYADGSRNQFTPEQLMTVVGEAEYLRLNRIAHRMTGHFHNV